MAEFIAIALIVVSYALGIALLLIVVFHLQHREADGTFLWTLTRALSEKTERVDPDDPKRVRIDYAPSSSRLIAFVGMGVILILFLGVGAVSIWTIMVGRELPDLERLGWFLAAGASLFVPYAANQIAGALKLLTRRDG